MFSNKSSMEVSSLNKERSSKLEALRIFSMLLIIIHHYSVHGGFDLAESGITLNAFFVQVLSLGGKIGVICFILITGYFMISSSFKFKKLLKLIFEVLFYSIGILILFTLLGIVQPDLKTIGACLLPITHSAYWFITVYVALYILSPFINKLLRTLTQKQHLILLGVLFVLISIIPTFLLGSLGFGNVGCFIFIYMIAAYIRLYPDSCNGLFSKFKLNLCLSLLFVALLILSVVAFDIIGSCFDLSIFTRNATYFMSLTSPLAIICGIFIFLSFKNSNIKNSKLINQVAISMFGVYLIHDNRFVRPFLWDTLFQNASYLTSPFLILHAAVAILITFAICVIIDQLRIILIEKPVFKLIDKLEVRITPQINSLKKKCNAVAEWLMHS